MALPARQQHPLGAGNSSDQTALVDSSPRGVQSYSRALDRVDKSHSLEAGDPGVDAKLGPRDTTWIVPRFRESDQHRAVGQHALDDHTEHVRRIGGHPGEPGRFSQQADIDRRASTSKPDLSRPGGQSTDPCPAGDLRTPATNTIFEFKLEPAVRWLPTCLPFLCSRFGRVADRSENTSSDPAGKP